MKERHSLLVGNPNVIGRGGRKREGEEEREDGGERTRGQGRGREGGGKLEFYLEVTKLAAASNAEVRLA